MGEVCIMFRAELVNLNDVRLENIEQWMKLMKDVLVSKVDNLEGNIIPD